MTDYAAQYQQLTSRRERLLQQVAVAEAQEANNADTRAQLEADLRAAGVDPSKPEEEAQRLQREIEAHRKGVSDELDEIERQLGGASTTATPKTPASQPIPASDDLDLN